MTDLDLPQLAKNAFPGLPNWLSALKLAAKSSFEETGFPARKDEEWLYTDIRPITHTGFEVASDFEATEDQLKNVSLSGVRRVVIVNGKIHAGLSDLDAKTPGLRVSNLEAAVKESSFALPLGRYAGFEKFPFVAMNTAEFSDCLVISVAKNVAIEQPIQAIYVSTSKEVKPTRSQPRTLVIAGENSQLTVIESWITLGEGIAFTNSVAEFELAESAFVTHYKINQTGDSSYHISTTQIQQASKSAFISQNITLGGGIVRNDINAVHSGEGVSTTLNGLSLADGTRIVDNHTSIDHATPNCESHELYKYILDGKGKGVFNGKIFVREDAQKTDAKQTNKTLLLSEDAQIDTKPQLEIYADDVKCTHGATIGQLDEKQLFYLRSRGISMADAKSLLVYAFAGEIIHRVKVVALRNQLDAYLLEKLPQN